ncbi:MAG: leucine-rich repeat domain-containing protein [Verrucomicrobia subdivision 3 bacterium]|nr:leucine-rich repeat domain-containing protein [Verrucomicrobiota bacterium]MCC6819527.1 leucine-rich repeat domain-containing protein [Limisphaerales bacterium]
MLSVFLLLPSIARAQFTYTTAAGKITITGYTGPGGAVAIPDTLSGLPVNGIASYAFYNISNLNGVTFGTNVTSIGDSAFASCTSLTNVALPKNVTSIGAGVFEDSDSLTAITVDPLNLIYSSADGVLFNKSQTTLLVCPGGKTGSYPVPDTVTTIAASSFYYCHKLTGVTFGTNVTTIGHSAFASCLGLTSVALPKNITTIEGTPFYACDSLTAITVDPLNLTYSSADGVLFNKSQTTLIEYPGGKAGSYTVPDSVTNIGSSAFTVCHGLPGITMGPNVAVIGDFAFSVCTSLTAVTLGTNVTSLGQYAFYGCTHLASVTIPDKVITIGGNAFAGCNALASATIGNSVTNIGTIAFGSCTNLTGLTLGTNVISIGTRAFAVCTRLPSVVIPKTVSSIGSAAFESCSSLTAITVDPLNLTYSSADGVLFNQSQTTLLVCPGGRTGSYTVPNHVTNIASRAFAFCTSLKEVYCPSNAPTAGTSVFASATNAPVYYLPGTTGWGATYGGRPTALWLPLAQSSGPGFGVQTNHFGFNISWAGGRVVVVEACTNLGAPSWSSLQTNTLTGSPFYFSDPDWTNHPTRFYRLRSP